MKRLRPLYALLMFCMCFLFSPHVARAESIPWTGAVGLSFDSGTGTKDDPFVIKTGAQWAFFAQQVTSGKTYEGQYIVLGDDINFGEQAIPIAGDRFGTRFKGNFSGQGHKVFNGHFEAVDGQDIGLFFYLDGAEVHNLTISEISYDGTAVKKSTYESGILATHASGSYVSKISIDNCDFKFNTENAGGLVGDTSNDFYVHDCSVTDTILTNTDTLGGLVGYNFDRVYVVNSRVSGGSLSAANYVGGVIGNSRRSTIRNCSVETTVYTGNASAGGFMGRIASPDMEYCVSKVNFVIDGTTKYPGGFFCNQSSYLSDMDRLKNLVSICTLTVPDAEITDAALRPIGNCDRAKNYDIANLYAVTTDGVTLAEDTVNSKELVLGSMDEIIAALDSDENTLFNTSGGTVSLNSYKEPVGFILTTVYDAVDAEGKTVELYRDDTDVTVYPFSGSMLWVAGYNLLDGMPEEKMFTPDTEELSFAYQYSEVPSYETANVVCIVTHYRYKVGTGSYVVNYVFLGKSDDMTSQEGTAKDPIVRDIAVDTRVGVNEYEDVPYILLNTNDISHKSTKDGNTYVYSFLRANEAVITSNKLSSVTLYYTREFVVPKAVYTVEHRYFLKGGDGSMKPEGTETETFTGEVGKVVGPNYAEGNDIIVYPVTEYKGHTYKEEATPSSVTIKEDGTTLLIFTYSRTESTSILEEVPYIVRHNYKNTTTGEVDTVDVECTGHAGDVLTLSSVEIIEKHDDINYTFKTCSLPMTLTSAEDKIVFELYYVYGDTYTEEGKLLVSITSDKAEYAPGDTINYTVAVENTSNEDYEDVELTCSLEGKWEMLPGFPMETSSLSLSKVAANDSQDVTYVSVVPENAEDGDKILNKVTVVAGNGIWASGSREVIVRILQQGEKYGSYKVVDKYQKYIDGKLIEVASNDRVKVPSVLVGTTVGMSDKADVKIIANPVYKDETYEFSSCSEDVTIAEGKESVITITYILPEKSEESGTGGYQVIDRYYEWDNGKTTLIKEVSRDVVNNILVGTTVGNVDADIQIDLHMQYDGLFYPDLKLPENITVTKDKITKYTIEYTRDKSYTDNPLYLSAYSYGSQYKPGDTVTFDVSLIVGGLAHTHVHIIPSVSGTWEVRGLNPTAEDSIYTIGDVDTVQLFQLEFTTKIPEDYDKNKNFYVTFEAYSDQVTECLVGGANIVTSPVILAGNEYETMTRPEGPDKVEKPSPSPDVTGSPSPSPEETESPAPSPEVTGSPVPSPEETESPAPSPEVTPSPETTGSPSPAPEVTVNPSPAPETPAPVPTNTPTPDSTPTPVPANTPTPASTTPYALYLDAWADTAKVGPGSTVVFDVYLRNESNASQTNVKITPTTAGTWVDGNTNYATNGTERNIGTLTAYQIVRLKYQVVVPSNLAVGSQFTLDMLVTSTEVPTLQSDNFNRATVTFTLAQVQPSPSPTIQPNNKLSLKVAEDSATHKAGESITYKIEVTNTGNTTLNNVVITNSADGSWANASNAGFINGKAITLKDLAPGVTAVVNYSVTLPTNMKDGDKVTNSVLVTCNEIQQRQSDNSNYYESTYTYKNGYASRTTTTSSTNKGNSPKTGDTRDIKWYYPVIEWTLGLFR